jgi:putative nucleotidyltransferase with HDIG domain
VFKPDPKYDEKVLAILSTILKEERTAKCLEEIRCYHLYTYWHCIRVTILALRLGLIRNLNNNELVRLGGAAILHDYGKLKVPLDILDKPDKLDDEEYELIKLHVLQGVLDLAELGFPKETLRAIAEHHEGHEHGYPFGLTVDEMSQMGRILRISDFYDALIVKRVYHEDYTKDEVLDIISKADSIDNNLLRLLRNMSI